MRDHHVSGLLRVCTAADPEVAVRLRHVEVLEERIRHVRVIMLSGVDDSRIAPVETYELVIERRHFHEIRPGCGDQMNQFSCHVWCVFDGASGAGQSCNTIALRTHAI